MLNFQHRAGTASLAGLGVGCGLALATALAGVLGALLFGGAPLDPTTSTAVSAVAMAASLIATALPALTATRVDPNVVLKAD
jgi:ABC-type antimicrobial peptide transport system permease subunit